MNVWPVLTQSFWFHQEFCIKVEKNADGIIFKSLNLLNELCFHAKDLNLPHLVTTSRAEKWLQSSRLLHRWSLITGFKAHETHFLSTLNIHE